jgi:hypothetical protein
MGWPSKYSTRSSPFVEKERERRKEKQLKLVSRIREVLRNVAISTPSFPLIGMKVGRTRGTVSGCGWCKEERVTRVCTLLKSCAPGLHISCVNFALSLMTASNLLTGIGRVTVISDLGTTFYSLRKTPISTMTFVKCNSHLYVLPY